MTKEQRQEIGKWCLDVSKYVVTAVVVSAVFNQIETIHWLVLWAALISIPLFVIGVYYLGDIKKRRK